MPLGLEFLRNTTRSLNTAWFLCGQRQARGGGHGKMGRHRSQLYIAAMAPFSLKDPEICMSGKGVTGGFKEPNPSI